VGPAKAGVALVGPSQGGRREGEEIDWAFAQGRPVVYVSFGSQAWHQPDRFDRLIEAAARLDVAILLAMGGLAGIYEAKALPWRVRCVRFAPQVAVLARARVAVTHGGANSVMEGLAAGVPLLISPLCNDQPHNLAFVERAGAGQGLDLDRCSVGELVGVLERLLGEGPERAAARRIRDSYAARSGARGAAELALGAIA